MDFDEPAGLSEREREIERSMLLEEMARAKIRTKRIMGWGSLFCFAMFPAGAFAGAFVDDLLGGIAGVVVVLLFPVLIGAMIAFFGMTMTDRRRNVTEWGLKRPSKCLGYGMLPYLLTLVFPPMLIGMIFWGLMAWGLVILGGWATAEIIDRSMSKRF